MGQAGELLRLGEALREGAVDQAYVVTGGNGWRTLRRQRGLERYVTDSPPRQGTPYPRDSLALTTRRLVAQACPPARWQP
jgi:hypothetical protein